MNYYTPSLLFDILSSMEILHPGKVYYSFKTPYKLQINYFLPSWYYQY